MNTSSLIQHNFFQQTGSFSFLLNLSVNNKLGMVDFGFKGRVIFIEFKVNFHNYNDNNNIFRIGDDINYISIGRAFSQLAIHTPVTNEYFNSIPQDTWVQFDIQILISSNQVLSIIKQDETLIGNIPSDGISSFNKIKFGGMAGQFGNSLNNHELDDIKVGIKDWGSDDLFSANFNDFSIVPPFDSISGSGLNASGGTLLVYNTGNNVYANKIIPTLTNINYNFTSKSGKFIDYQNNYVYSYDSNEINSISGNISPNSIDYYINNNPIAFGMKRASPAPLDYFYINPTGCEVDFDLFIKGDKPDYVITYPDTFDSGIMSIPITITNNNLLTFNIFSGIYLGDITKANLSGVPFSVTNGDNNFYINQSGLSGNVSFPFQLLTNFGPQNIIINSFGE